MGLNRMKQVIVIPARMSGTRLSGKPLIMIKGAPMIWHVWSKCRKIHDPSLIYIATEDVEIEEYCSKMHINCVNTGPADTAIDRIKLFSDLIAADAYINVQGDEPIVNTKDIKTILSYNKSYPDRIVFGKTLCSESEFYDYSKAKVVCSKSGRLMYSSRAGIPITNKGKFLSAERAIWIYAFNKKSLDSYFNCNYSEIEKIEDNEIIRFLELDIPVFCVDVIGDSWAVDEIKDVEIVEGLLDLTLN
jgi:3-deoxy-manno-octulosonate cytidylyltransferase (CMP-KDO synthetase)